MKILRMFDSLKFVRAMFVAVACVFILNVAHADNPNCANYIDYTSATGTLTQNGTPTPTNPIEPVFYTQGKMVLRAIGDVADSYDATTQTITRNIGVKAFDGTENFTALSTPNAFRLSFSAPDRGAAGTNPMCSHYPAATITLSVANMPDKTVKGHTTAANSFYLKDSRFDTEDELKTWLAAQYAAGTPVIMYYVLATPVTEDWPSRQCETIKIATTKYNEQQFAPVETRLDAAVAAVNTVVTQTMSQAQAIDQIATNKQTRPDEGCTAKYCLLIEDENGTPHWYPIAGANGIAHNLPAGYTELQYIESTGTQYIDTGFVGTINTDIEIKGADFTERSAQLVVTTTTTSGSQLRIAKFTATQKVGAGIGTSTPTYSTSDGVSQFVAKLENHNLYLDGQLVGAVSTDGFNQSEMGNVLIFSGVYGSNRYYGIGKIYYVKIWDNNTLVRDLIPAKNSSGVVGMYDMASGQFFTNAGTGTFTAGPDM